MSALFLTTGWASQELPGRANDAAPTGPSSRRETNPRGRAAPQAQPMPILVYFLPVALFTRTRMRASSEMILPASTSCSRNTAIKISRAPRRS